MHQFEVTTVTNLQAHNLSDFTQKYAKRHMDLPIKEPHTHLSLSKAFLPAYML